MIPKTVPCALLLLTFAGLIGLAAPPAAFAGDVEVDGAFVSTAPTGTAPLDVSSTTLVDGLNADMLDGMDASAFAPDLAQVIYVSSSGGDFASVQAALNSITDAAQLKPYLIKVGPGVFEEQVTMKPYVDIEGSGEGVTIIQSRDGTTVTGASDAELRDLTVRCFEASSPTVLGISNHGAAPSIRRVKVTVFASTVAPRGIANTDSSIAPIPEIRDVSVVANGPGAVGIINDGVATELTDVDVYARGDDAHGIENTDSGAVLRRVTVLAVAETVNVSDPVAIVNSGSPPVELVDVDAEVTRGEYNWGIRNGGASQPVKMTRVRVTARAGGGSYSYAVRNFEGDTELIDCELHATDGSSANYAMWNNRSSSKIVRSTLYASGSGLDYALHNNDTNGSGAGGPWTVQVHGSRLIASSSLLANPKKFTTVVATTYFSGGGIISDSGTLTCAGVYDGAFDFYPSTCP